MRVSSYAFLFIAFVACSSKSTPPSGDDADADTPPVTNTDTDTPVPPADEEPTTVAEELTVAQYFSTVHGLSLSNVYWGDMHTHSFYSQDAAAQAMLDPDAQPVNPSVAYARARERGFSFASVTDHAEAPVPGQIPDDAANVWESARRMTAEATDAIADDNGVFFPFMGFEYTNPFPCTDSDEGDGKSECGNTCTSLGGAESCEAYGHKNVVFRSTERAPAERATFLEPSSWTVSGDACVGEDADSYCGFDTYSSYAFTNVDLWDWLASYDLQPASAEESGSVLTIIHTPGNIHHVDWDVIDERFVRNVEIFSQWGNSEGPQSESCVGDDDIEVDLPAGNINRDEDLIRPQLNERWLIEGDVRYALSFVGGSDDHSGNPGGNGNGNGAVTGLFTTDVSQEGFFAELYHRRTIASTYYASTGPLPLLFSVATGGTSYLGGDIAAIGDDGVVTLRVLAAEAVQQVQIVVDGCTMATLDGAVQQITLSDLDPATRHYIYVRARVATTEADDVDEETTAATEYNQTWSSPVYLTPSVPL